MGAFHTADNITTCDTPDVYCNDHKTQVCTQG